MKRNENQYQQVIKDIQQKVYELDDDLRWLIALLSDTGMRLEEKQLDY